MKKLFPILLVSAALMSFTGRPYSGNPFNFHIHKITVRDVNNNVVNGNYYLYVQTGDKFFVYDPAINGGDITIPIDGSSRLAFGYPKDRSMKACSFEVQELYKFVNGNSEYEIGISVLAHEGTGTVSTYKKEVNFATEDFSASMKKFPVKNTDTTRDIAGIAFFSNVDQSQKATRKYSPLMPR